MRSLACRTVVALLVTLASAGCGSAGAEADDEDAGAPGEDDGSVPLGAFASQGGFDAGSLAACATSQSAAALIPVNLVFLYDTSGSMGAKNRWFTCNGNPSVIQCAFFKVSKGPSPRYVCYPEGQQANLAVNAAGDLYYNNSKCGTGTVGGEPAVLCSNPANCTLADYFDPAAKWVPVGQAITAFFADAKSTGLSASLGFFPLIEPNVGTRCQLADYSTPALAMTPLPNATAFKSAIDAQSPNGNTPTEIALSGALAYAKTVAAARPAEVTAVVLVSDGDPTECASSNAQPISVVEGVAKAAANEPTRPIKTYVIGVGASLSNLNKIASGGGTGSATLVSASSPTQTATDFQTALEKIRGEALSCDVPLPQPPDGKTLDINTVNVVATIGGKEEVLTYNKDCTNGSGWHYDDANAPTRVQLCDASCKTVRAGAGGKLAITFGCATKGGVIR